MSEKVKQAMEYVTANGQDHLIPYLKPVFSDKSRILAEDILSLDLKKIKGIFDSVTESKSGGHVEDDLEPLKVLVKEKADPGLICELNKIGEERIRSGKVAAITMAGGKGTRLGHDGPKGTFVLPFLPEKSLFRIQAEGLMEIGQIPWLIMTSNDNHDATVDYFKTNNYFGYDSEFIKFFPQNEAPTVDTNGKLLVKNGRIVRAADGNGGIFSALSDSGNLNYLENIGIEKVFICGIDNAFIKMADPVFVGYAFSEAKDITSKSVIKRSFDEKVGVFCRRNGRPAYIEYTEISDEHAKEKDENGEFVFGDAGIVAYVYDISLLRKMGDKPLPYHAAHKKVEYSTPEGETIKPDKPNAIKFESFIFDSFDYADDVAVLRVDREEEFAPIKNRTGEDSPEELKRRLKQR